MWLVSTLSEYHWAFGGLGIRVQFLFKAEYASFAGLNTPVSVDLSFQCYSLISLCPRWAFVLESAQLSKRLQHNRNAYSELGSIYGWLSIQRCERRGGDWTKQVEGDRKHLLCFPNRQNCASLSLPVKQSKRLKSFLL
jgi:hypothetical protein